jgi:hypothetical protein
MGNLLDKLDNLDDLDNWTHWTRDYGSWIAYGYRLRTSVAQIDSQRVTFWKNVCLLFWSFGANHSEGGGDGQMFMDGIKAVCVVCVN